LDRKRQELHAAPHIVVASVDPLLFLHRVSARDGQQSCYFDGA
jgi:hypothetical protein